MRSMISAMPLMPMPPMPMKCTGPISKGTGRRVMMRLLAQPHRKFILGLRGHRDAGETSRVQPAADGDLVVEVVEGADPVVARAVEDEIAELARGDGVGRQPVDGKGELQGPVRIARVLNVAAGADDQLGRTRLAKIEARQVVHVAGEDQVDVPPGGVEAGSREPLL